MAASVQLLVAMLGSVGTAGAADLETAAVLLAAAVSVAAAWVCLGRHDTAYGLTLLWALVAVFEACGSTAMHRAALAGIAVTGLATLASGAAPCTPAPLHPCYSRHPQRRAAAAASQRCGRGEPPGLAGADSCALGPPALPLQCCAGAQTAARAQTPPSRTSLSSLDPCEH